MATTMSSPRVSLSTIDPQPSIAKYDDLVTELLASTSTTYNIHNLKDRFLDKALETQPETFSSSSSPSKKGIGAIGSGWEMSGRTDPGNPLNMDDEIKGQKDYLRRLKFKYLEQEAKLIFLGSITTDEPQTALDDQIDEAERANAVKKELLKKTKEEVRVVRDEAEEIGRKVEVSLVELGKETQEAAILNKQIKEMELELARLRAMYPIEDRMTTPLANSILDSQITSMQTLDASLKTISTSIDISREGVSRTAKEVGRLTREKDREEGKAKEARMGRKGSSEVDELCRWYTSATDLYRQLLGIKSLTPISSTELHIEYTIPPSSSSSSTGGGNRRKSGVEESVVLKVEFDGVTKRLIDAKLINNPIDIQESVDIAVTQNDVRGLIGEVLARLR